MKTLLAVAVVLLLLAGPARAADARLSQDSLARLGLGGMQPISDAQGAQIRGTPAFLWPIGVFPLPLVF
jgi:hypothetical protein